MKCAAETASGVMIYTPNFIQSGSGIQKLMGGQKQKGDVISLFLFFKKSKVG
jgi:hypothetical protein